MFGGKGVYICAVWTLVSPGSAETAAVKETFGSGAFLFWLQMYFVG